MLENPVDHMKTGAGSAVAAVAEGSRASLDFHIEDLMGELKGPGSLASLGFHIEAWVGELKGSLAGLDFHIQAGMGDLVMMV